MMKVIEKYTKHENINYKFFTALVLNAIEKYDKVFDKTELIIKKRKSFSSKIHLTLYSIIKSA